MMIPFRVLSIAAILPLMCSAWNCDARCPIAIYVECLEQEAMNNGRELEMPHDEPLKSKLPLRDESMSVNRSPANNNNKKLRGLHRRLQMTYFQMKLYHEPGYCWQSEWEDRVWCAECTGDCEEWDDLDIQFCDQNEDKQYFSYEPMPDGIGGRIKPMTDESLCLERTRVNAHQLRPCDDINGVVNVTQIFKGFDLYDKFELHPYNRADDTTNAAGPTCLSNHHHPKEDEVVRAEDCAGARAANTNFWITYNAYTDGTTTSINSESPSASPPLGSVAGGSTNSETGIPSESPSEQQTPPNAEPTPQTATLATDVPSSTSSDSPTVSPSATPSAKTTLEPSDSLVGTTTSAPSPSATLSPSDAPFVIGGTTEAPVTLSPVTPAPSDKTSSSPSLLQRHLKQHRGRHPPIQSPSPLPSEQTKQGEDPLVDDRGWDGCKKFNKCGHCAGDCDNDDECEEGLICYKRPPNSTVPTCSGGESIHFEKDLCIPPDWNIP